MHSRPNVMRIRRLVISISVCASLGACGRTAADVSTATTSDSTRDSTPVTRASVAPPSDSARLRSTHAPRLADTLDPAATVRAYLSRARAHRATRDTSIWEPGADSTTGYRAFVDTTITSSTVGRAGSIEGAAGSRYVTLPLAIDVVSGASHATLRGAATLRRGVVDGATDAQRTWRIVRIEWSAKR